MAKFLVLHADDLGMCRSVDDAIFFALKRGFVSSASVMVPGSEFERVCEFKRSNPKIDLGIHLTLTSETKKLPFKPVSDKRKVPSLLAPNGGFWLTPKELYKNASLKEMEFELSAQIEKALSRGLTPSHMDCHMHAHRGSKRLSNILDRLSRSYRVPLVRSKRYNGIKSGERKRSPLSDYYAAPSDLSASQWETFYFRILRKMKPEVHQIELHPGRDSVRLRALLGRTRAWGSAWRQRDFDLVCSRGFRKALKENDIRVVSWKDIPRY